MQCKCPVSTVKTSLKRCRNCHSYKKGQCTIFNCFQDSRTDLCPHHSEKYQKSPISSLEDWATENYGVF